MTISDYLHILFSNIGLVPLILIWLGVTFGLGLLLYLVFLKPRGLSFPASVLFVMIGEIALAFLVGTLAGAALTRPHYYPTRDLAIKSVVMALLFIALFFALYRFGVVLDRRRNKEGKDGGDAV